MTLPAPNLDDRRFQPLVDEAKRYVQQRCPEWTDHNVSDPGVTLIELFAWMTDQLVYRLNRVPERNYVKFLELIGIKLFPPTAARADVTFWLSAPQRATVKISKGTEVATLRSESSAAIPFATIDDLAIVPCSAKFVKSSIAEGEFRDHSEGVTRDAGFFCFDAVPKPGDALLVGLSDPTPRCAVTLRFDCEIEGVGVDPRNAPIVWEAWTDDGWRPCDVSQDETGGLNKAGDVIVHIHPGHEASVIDRHRAGWIRCRVVENEENQPAYGASPKIKSLSAFTIGGTAETVNAESVDGEIVGTSEGVPGQRFLLARRPVVPAENPVVVETSTPERWEEWREVSTFAGSEPTDRHFLLDATTGEISFGPAVRLPDGSMRQYGSVPPKGSAVRIRSYLTGGGRNGNVAKFALSVLRSPFPFVARVENRRPAFGGVDVEDLEAAKVRGAIALRTRNRAVTAEDYEQLAEEAAPEVARIRCVPAGGETTDGVRILVVPHAPQEDGRIEFEHLVPSEDTLTRIARYLDERRVIGARAVVEPPSYQGVTVVASLRARPGANATRIQQEALASLNGYFNPLSGGPDGNGWPFGRAVHVGEIYSALQGVRGVEMIQDARLFAADPISGERGKETQSVTLEPNALVFSYEHQIQVVEAEGA